MKVVEEITLEQARAVINAHYAAEMAAMNEESRKLIGRFFTTETTQPGYSGDDERSWICVAVTGVDGSGWPTGLRVVLRLRKTTLFDSPFVRTPFNSWTEIDRSEFRRLIAIVPEEELAAI